MHEDAREQLRSGLSSRPRSLTPFLERIADWVYIHRPGPRVGRFVRSTRANKLREVGGLASTGCGEES